MIPMLLLAYKVRKIW